MHTWIKKSIIICMLLFVIIVIIQIFVNTPSYLNWKIDQVKKEYFRLVDLGEQEMQKFAASFCEEAAKHKDGLCWDRYRSDIPRKLEKALAQILEFSPIRFDAIYVGGPTQLIYPTGSCVFRYTIKDYRGVYAWVDLVYAPSYDGANLDEYAGLEEITDNWYIIILFGF